MKLHGLFQWHADPRYHAVEALRTYRYAVVAQKAADRLNELPGNAVVVRPVDVPGVVQ